MAYSTDPKRNTRFIYFQTLSEPPETLQLFIPFIFTVYCCSGPQASNTFLPELQPTHSDHMRSDHWPLLNRCRPQNCLYVKSKRGNWYTAAATGLLWSFHAGQCCTGSKVGRNTPSGRPCSVGPRPELFRVPLEIYSVRIPPPLSAPGLWRNLKEGADDSNENDTLCLFFWFSRIPFRPRIRTGPELNQLKSILGIPRRSPYKPRSFTRLLLKM